MRTHAHSYYDPDTKTWKSGSCFTCTLGITTNKSSKLTEKLNTPRKKDA